VFTGIIERTGTIVGTTPVPGGRRLRVDIGPIARETSLGASIAVSGVCLTVAYIDDTTVDFDVITETLDRTTLGLRKPGDLVNLERSLRAGDRLDGHFVQGHVDGTAAVRQITASAKEHVVRLEADEALRPYLIPKGSVAMDGISLTIAAVDATTFSVALIPTTLELTTLARVKSGDRVNLESDILARTIVHRLQAMRESRALTMEALQRAGFA